MRNHLPTLEAQLLNEVLKRSEAGSLCISYMARVLIEVAEAGAVAPDFYHRASRVLIQVLRKLRSHASWNKDQISAVDAAKIIRSYSLAGEPAPQLLVRFSNFLTVHPSDDVKLRSKDPKSDSIIPLKELVKTMVALCDQGIPAEKVFEKASIRLTGALKGSAQRYVNHLPEEIAKAVAPILAAPLGSSQNWKLPEVKSETMRPKYPVSFSATVLSPREITDILWCYSTRECWCNYGLLQHGLRLLSVLYYIHGDSITAVEKGSVWFPQEVLVTLWTVIHSIGSLSPWPDIAYNWINPKLRTSCQQAVFGENFEVDPFATETDKKRNLNMKEQVNLAPTGKTAWKFLVRLFSSPLSSLSNFVDDKLHQTDTMAPGIHFGEAPKLTLKSSDGLLTSVMQKYFQPLCPHGSGQSMHMVNDSTKSTRMYHKENTEAVMKDFIQDLKHRRKDILIAEPSTYAEAFPLPRVDLVWRANKVVLLLFGCEHLAPTSSLATRPHLPSPHTRSGVSPKAFDRFSIEQLCESLRPWHYRRLDTRFLRPQCECRVRLLERHGWKVVIVYTFEWEDAKAQQNTTTFFRERLPTDVYYDKS